MRADRLPVGIQADGPLPPGAPARYTADCRP